MIEYTIFTIYMAAILVSAIAAVVFGSRLKKWHLSIMVIYLPLVFLMEVYTSLRLYVWKNPTPLVYNIYKPATVLIFGWFFYTIPFMGRFRKIIMWIMITYFCLAIVSYFTIRTIGTYNYPFLTLARSICLTFFGVFYLIGVFQLDDVAKELFWKPVTWVAIGVVIFYPVIAISLGLEVPLREYHLTIQGSKLYQSIPRIMSVFLYGCFTYAFYLCKKAT